MQKAMKMVLVLLLSILFQPVWVTAQKGYVSGVLGEQLDDLMTSFSKEGYSGAVLVARNGEIILRKGYGLADRERKIQNSPETLFSAVVHRRKDRNHLYRQYGPKLSPGVLLRPSSRQFGESREMVDLTA